MAVTPRDILNLVQKKQLESDFLVSLAQHRGSYTIAELTDKVLQRTDSGCRLLSQTYHIDVSVEDPEVVAARNADRYISAFLSRHNDAYRVHFLIHPCARQEKPLREEAILREVMDYMMLHTIVALRLDSEEKLLQYCGK